ncbi:MAG TPA: hypothetical protein VGX28_08620 [Frankiaceae bacterium]|jgi:hypothetical protein|nr:hypothetical protein [Frankiaceae bacterium]
MNDLYGRAAAAVLAAAVLAACGGDGKGKAPEAGASTTNPPIVSIITTTPTAGAPSGASGGASAKPGTGGSAAPGTSAKPGTTTAPHGAGPTTGPGTGGSPGVHDLDLHATLDKSCVTPNSMLTLSLTGRPGMNVIFNTTYADGKDGEMHGGKEMHGMTDAQGSYRTTFLVNGTAPAGDATLYLGAVDQVGTGSDTLPFRVALTC